MGAEWQDVVGKVAGAIGLAGSVPYVLSTLRGQTRPNRATWIIWALVGAVMASSYYATGGGPSIWVPVSSLIGPLVVAAVSLKYGEGGWTRFDVLSVAGAAASFSLWLASGSAFTALVTSIGIDAFGALPTIRKAWCDPQSEDPVAWSLFVLASTLNLAAVPTWSPEIAVLPLYFVAVSGSVTVPLLRRALIGLPATAPEPARTGE